MLAGVQVGALLVLPNFFGHYKGWIAPAAALTIGVSAATLIGRLGQDGWRPIAARIAYGLALATLAAAAVIYRQGTRLPTVAFDAEIATARCVAADSPVLLIETGTLRRDLDAHCPLKLDPSGTSYDTDRNLAPAAARTRLNLPEYQRVMAAYYSSDDAALFMRLTSGDGFTRGTWATIKAQLPVDTKAGPVTALLRAAGSGPVP